MVLCLRVEAAALRPLLKVLSVRTLCARVACVARRGGSARVSGLQETLLRLRKCWGRAAMLYQEQSNCEYSVLQRPRAAILCEHCGKQPLSEPRLLVCSNINYAAAASRRTTTLAILRAPRRAPRRATDSLVPSPNRNVRRRRRLPAHDSKQPSTPPRHAAARNAASLCSASIARLNAPAPASPWNKLSGLEDRAARRVGVVGQVHLGAVAVGA